MVPVLRSLGMSDAGLDRWPGRLLYPHRDLDDSEISDWCATCLAQSVLPSAQRPRMHRTGTVASLENMATLQPVVGTFKNLEACMIARSSTLVVQPLLMRKVAQGHAPYPRPRDSFVGTIRRIVGPLHIGSLNSGHWVTVVWDFDAGNLLLLNSLPRCDVPPATVAQQLATDAPWRAAYPKATFPDTHTWRVVRPSLQPQLASECGLRACLWVWAFGAWPEHFARKCAANVDPMQGWVQDTGLVASVMAFVTWQCTVSGQQ